MKNLFETVILSVCIPYSVIAQTSNIKNDIKALFLPQGYVLESISGYGYSNVTKISIPNISSNNPASLLDLKKLSLGISLQSDSDIKNAWAADLRHKRIDNHLPQSFGIVFPLNNFRIGYGFSQRYNTEIIFNKIEILAPSYPEGNGNYFLPIQKTYITTNSLSASFSIYKKDVSFSFGTQYSRNRLNHNEEIYNTNLNDNDYKDSWSFGVIYNKLSRYRFGAFYEGDFRFKKLTPIVFTVDPDTISESVANLSDSFYVIGDFPAKFHIGFTYRIFPNIQVIGNSTYVFWNDISRYFKDQVELSGSIVHRLNNSVSYSVGFYKTNREYNEGYGINGNKKQLMAFYMMSGLILRLNFLEIELTVADSHLFSGDWRKQTIGKIGFGIYL